MEVDFIKLNLLRAIHVVWLYFNDKSLLMRKITVVPIGILFCAFNGKLHWTYKISRRLTQNPKPKTKNQKPKTKSQNQKPPTPLTLPKSLANPCANPVRSPQGKIVSSSGMKLRRQIPSARYFFSANRIHQLVMARS